MPNHLFNVTRFLTLLVCSILTASCANSPLIPGPELQDLNDDIETVYTSIDQLRAGMEKQYTEICASQYADMRDDHAETKKRHAATRKRLATTQNDYARLEKRCETRNVIGKLLVGEVENVRLLKEDLTFSARIDTGAETSSLGVYRLQDFERDGKTWVKFKLKDKKSAPTYEYPVSGRVRVKQSADSAADERFEIKMNIGMGNKDYPRQVFNLADRSYLDHQLMMGRSFLTDVAIVDTGSKYRLKN